MKRLFNYFHPFAQITRARESFVKRHSLPESLLALLLGPQLEASQPTNDVSFIVLDIETTGLDCNEDLILSIGWVFMTGGKIDLASSQHMYINSDSQIKPETAVINHITPQMLSEGVTIHQAMATLFEAAHGKILVAHGCMVETNFINKYLERVMGIHQPPLIWIDTLRIEKQLQKTFNTHEQIDVTLSNTRQRYALPEYNNHSALIDAVATAELLLAQQHRINPQGYTTIGTLYRLSK
ncbi:3'-5' exonuclease [Vibrio taketomensis]|uniref:3'-5' exonuclease n=1 Tax=Vibrio taketomensis TaxID=2572923 RepID=UPI001389D0F4|nr:3'-5' exonuclease [Vibrio taketomensis]